MEKDDKIFKDKGLSRRSGEVNEVMGEIPHWITRWGMVLMALVLIGFGFGMYVVKVPEYTGVSYVIKGGATPAAQTVPTGGVLSALAQDSVSVSIRQAVAHVLTPEGDSPVVGNAGGCFRRNLLYKEGMEVVKGDTIGWILPVKASAQTILLKIPAAISEKVRKGQAVHLILPDGKDFISGQIQVLAGVAMNGYILAEVRLSGGCPFPAALHSQTEGSAKILVGRQRLIDKLSLFKSPLQQ